MTTMTSDKRPTIRAGIRARPRTGAWVGFFVAIEVTLAVGHLVGS